MYVCLNCDSSKQYHMFKLN